MQLPDRVEGDGLVLRQWEPADAPALNDAILSCVDHLAPWLPWVITDPQTVDARREFIEQSVKSEESFAYGIFVDDRIAGGIGLHARITMGGLEIGYWVHPDFTRRGVATTAARLLTDAAFTDPDVTHVEIHHDELNTISASIPARLGYTYIEARPGQCDAPEGNGVRCIWRVTRQQWAYLSARFV